ncbi:MAG: hypothetical protein JWR63_2303 [Conexibacter sp.]|nr:hypothetical protein [Conexibacter sp.]
MSQPPDPDDTRSNALGILNRFRVRAGEALTDVPAVEDFLERADARSKKSAALSESLAPLRRLIRSYVRGSYRDADSGDVAWALAAVMYVASPLDAIPDFLPGGLRDDEMVAAWVHRRVESTIRAYEAWETSIGEGSVDLNAKQDADAMTYMAAIKRIPDPTPAEAKANLASNKKKWLKKFESSDAELGLDEHLGPAPFVAPSPSAQALDVVVLDGVDSSLFNRLEPGDRRALPSIAANQALLGAAQVHAAAQIQGALQAGQVVRVFGPPGLLEGLAAKTLEMVPSSGGNLGAVREVGGSGFVGQLRFGDLETQNVPNPNLALAGFQFASAVTLQYYLARIDRQLGVIDKEIRGTRQDTRDERYGRIEAARKQCELAERILAGTSGLNNHDARRLDLAAHDLDQTYEALEASVKSFCERVEATDLVTVSKSDLDGLLRDGAGVAVTDTQLLLYAAVVRHRIGGVQAFLLSDDGEHRSRIAHEDLDATHQEMVAFLTRAQAAMRKLNLPKRALDKRFRKLGGPETSLDQYSARSKGVRELLSSPQHVLPAYTPQEPFVMDLRLGEDQRLEAEWAYVRRSEPAVG